MAQWNTANDMKKEYADVIAQQENSGLRGLVNAAGNAYRNYGQYVADTGLQNLLYQQPVDYWGGKINQSGQAVSNVAQGLNQGLNAVWQGNNNYQANQNRQADAAYNQKLQDLNAGRGLWAMWPNAKQTVGQPKTQQTKPVSSAQTNPQTIAQPKITQVAPVTNPATTHGLANTLLMQQLTALQQPPRLGLEQRPEDGLIMGANDPNSMNNQADNYKIARMASIANSGYDQGTEHAMIAALNNSWENRDSQKPKLMDLAGLAVKPQPAAPKYEKLAQEDDMGNKKEVLVNPAAFAQQPIIDPTAGQPNSREKISKVLTAMQNAKLAGDNDSYNTLYDHYLKLGGKPL